jgi:hypothetical protein
MLPWLLLITFKRKRCLGEDTELADYSPECAGLCGFLHGTGGRDQMFWVLVCSDTEQALALLPKLAVAVFWPGYLEDQMHSFRRSLPNLLGLPCISGTEVQTVEIAFPTEWKVWVVSKDWKKTHGYISIHTQECMPCEIIIKNYSDFWYKIPDSLWTNAFGQVL